MAGGGHDSLTTRDVGISLLSCCPREAYDLQKKKIFFRENVKNNLNRTVTGESD